MDIEKVSWNNSADRVKFTLPLTKVNEELRQVSGFASLDNADQHDDIVLADASARAFSRFRGNIREMHQPIAVGKMVDFKEDSYFDAKENKTYKGIYVTVKVSKGAQDTWEKVLDGTLTGFSIGGHIVDAESTIIKSENGGKDRSIRLIKEYELEELSLVDNPANQLANVFSIQKTADGQVTGSGFMLEKSTENVYYCKEDSLAKTSPEDSYNCPKCGKAMPEAGWIEYSDDVEKVSKIADCLKSFNTKEDSTDVNNEGGVEMSEEVTKSVTQPDSPESDIEVGEQGKAQTEIDSSVENVSDEDSEVEEDEPVESEDEVSEVEKETDELSKMLDNLREDISGDIQKNFDDITNKVETVTKSFDEFGKKIEDKFKDLESMHGELSKRVAGLKNEIDSVEKSLRKLEGNTAVKKSGDLGGSSEKVIRKSGDDTNYWNGAFLGSGYLDN